MNSYLLMPGCDDGNRGDQALVWETKRLAEAAGFLGKYSMICSDTNTDQSVSECISIIAPVLGHPSRKFRNKDNTSYTPLLMMKWGAVAIGDYVVSRLIYHSFTRRLISRFLPAKIRQSIRYISCCDACFVKGGGFIHSYGKITDIYTIYFFLYHIRLAQHLGKKVYVMPNSFGPFLTSGIKGQVRKALDRCEFVSTRETLSQEMLREIGVSAEVFPDLAFGLDKTDDVIPEIEGIKAMAAGRRLVAVTARPYRFPNCANASERYHKYIDALTAFIQWVYHEGFFPVLVEHVISVSTNESDIVSLKQIASGLDDSQYCLFSNPSYTCRQLMEFYAHMDVVIGTRFHSVIFSLASGIPAIAIAYGGNKSRGIMKDIGLIDYTVDMDQVTAEHLIQRFKTLISNEREVKSSLDRRRGEFFIQRAALIERLKDDTVNA